MPELPEVQTVVDYISPKLVGRKIKSCTIYEGFDKLLSGLSVIQIRKKVIGNKVLHVSRRAKYIILHLDEGYLAIHLRMTGQIYFGPKPPKYTRFSMALSRGSLHFIDVRKFGTIKYSDDLDYLDAKVGVEPLTRNFNQGFLNNLLASKTTKLKALLLDQKYIAGLGNIYVDEALWFAGLHPETKANLVKPKQAALLLKGIKKVLKDSIAHQGTTFINFYFADGESGNFKNKLKVFNRTGEPCKRCKTEIVKFRAAGRGTHICPKCQRK